MVTPPHFGNNDHQILNEHLLNKLTGRGGSLAWTPKSPDLRLLDFFLSNCVKNIIYQGKIAVLQTQ
jgi:hypothetical protein